MSYETEFYNLLCEVEKNYYAYYEEFIKQLDKAKTQAEFEKIYDGVTKRFDFYVQEFAKNDVVKVVRCKNCEHKTTITDAITKKTSNICLLGEALNFVDENDYCSHGKRKEGVENE